MFGMRGRDRAPAAGVLHKAGGGIMKTSEHLKMIDKTKHCCSRTLKALATINSIIFNLTLRQGTILIAVHQIALSSFAVIVLLVGVSHVGEMQALLHADMEDDAERRGFYDVTYGEHLMFHEGEGLSTNNQKRFASAQNLAFMTMAALYTGTLLMLLYLGCCVSLLYGAVHRRREYVLVWIAGACVATVVAVAGSIFADHYHFVVQIFGSRHSYHIFVILGILAFVYGILCVSVFVLELDSVEAHMVTGVCVEGDKGERLLLLDHAAHSNLLSTAQLEKLTEKGSYQFV